MIQFVNILSTLNLDWSMDSRIWNNVVLISEQYDYANQITTPNVQADVVTVKSLQLYSIQDGNCIYTSLLQVGTNFFKNVLIFLDIDLQVNPKCKNAEISFANSVTGTFTNVSLTGSIRITSTTAVNLNISKFVGHIFNNFVATNCFSNVTFTVNGTAQSTSSGSVTLFETSFDANSIALLSSGPTCTLDTKSVTSCSGTYTYKVNQAASAHPGIIKEYYEAKFQLLEWKQMRSKYFYLDFDVAGAFTPDVRLSAQRAYYSPGTTKIAVFMADGSILECSQLYDPVSKSCVPTCSGKLFEKFCQGSCPNGSYSASDSQTCYVMCPTTLGYSLSGTVCTKCSNFAVDLGGCVASCPSTSPVVNGSGCFPRTMIQNTFTEDSCASVCDPGYLMDSTCKVACSDGLIAKSSLRTCVACSSEYNGGPFWKRNGAVCASSCDYLNGTYCEDLASTYCEYYYLDGSQKKCVHTCPVGYPYLQETEKRCYTTCPNTYLVDTPNMKCVTSCAFYERDSVSGVLTCVTDCTAKFNGLDNTYSTTVLRCEAACSMFSTTKFTKDNLCQDQCDGAKPYFITGNICVAQCYDQASLKFLNEGSNACVSTCASGSYYRVNADQFLFCTPAACAASNFTGVESYHATYTRCENSCALFQTLNFIDGQLCKSSCPASKPFYDASKNCSATCTMFVETNGQCVAHCSSGIYSVVSSIKTCQTADCTGNFVINASDSNSKQCVTQCHDQPTFKFVNAVTKECVNGCAFYERDSVSGVLTCVTDCTAKFNGLDNTYSTTVLRCEAACSMFSTTKFTKDNLCQDQCDGAKPYFITGNICVAQCYDQASLKFLNEGSNACVSTCASGSYYRVNADQFLFCTPAACAASNFTGVESYHATYTRCENSCALFQTLNFIDGQLCKSSCPASKPFYDASKNCSATCTMFVETNGQCVAHCSSGIYSVVSSIKTCQTADCTGNFVINASDSNSKQCVTQCHDQPTFKFVNAVTKECVNGCAFYERDSVSGVLTCVTDCTAKFNGLDNTYSTTVLRCEAACSMFSTTKFTKDNLCQDQCDGAKPYFITGNICVAQCYDQASLKFLNEGSNACVSTCASGSYYRVNADQFLFCTPAACAASNFTGVESYHATYTRCENSCALFQTLNFIDGQLCKSSCPASKPFYDASKNCSATCTMFVETNGQCVAHCSSGIYSVVSSIKTCQTADCTGNFVINASDSNSKQCVTQCHDQPTFKFVNAVTKECVNGCAFYERDSVSGVLTCVTDCNSKVNAFDTTYSSSVKRCEASCTLFSITLYKDNDVCVAKCQLPNQFQDGSECKSSCSSGFYWQDQTKYTVCLPSCGPTNVSANDGLVGTRCEITCSDFTVNKVQVGQTCTSDCQEFIHNGVCVPSCTLYQLNFCVDKCSTGFMQYGNICSDCVLDANGVCSEILTAEQGAVKSSLSTSGLIIIGIICALLVIVLLMFIKLRPKKDKMKITIESGPGNFFANEIEKTFELRGKGEGDAEEEVEDVFSRHLRERIVIKL
ncbi:Conserved_hypothetical protein [Hexamita inflata]|uniref:Uncharacterized protein n=1 Tax=Hexamita inflata TaxID=28002 RepID=A0AA86VF83_9EUKA|nr:Conserved hypothetical protein [Hexamita inflata]CAI9965023.1 Conserved hypothetical protein [Hexamita inflata]